MSMSPDTCFHDAHRTFDEKNISWISISGNHDPVYGNRYSLKGNFAYDIKIQDSRRGASRIIVDDGGTKYYLLFLDSSTRCDSPDQTVWFEEDINSLPPDVYHPGLAFMHIPPPEFVDIRHQKSHIYGVAGEYVHCCSHTNVVDRLKQYPGYVRGIVSGHDHDNNYEYNCDLEDEFCFMYGTKTGMASYGPDFFKKGVKIIELSPNGNRTRIESRIFDTSYQTTYMTNYTYELKTDQLYSCGSPKKEPYYYPYKYLSYKINLGYTIALAVLILYYCVKCIRKTRNKWKDRKDRKDRKWRIERKEEKHRELPRNVVSPTPSEDISLKKVTDSCSTDEL